MMNMTTIGLIRHGVTDWNTERRAQGHTDVPLNEEGRRQAALLAARLQREQWDLLYSSDLSRARETADSIAKMRNLQVLEDARLREMYCGQVEGTTEADRINKWGPSWSELDLGQESDESIAERGLTCLDELARRHSGRKILVVSHGTLIGITLKKLIPHYNTERHLLNTSLTVIRRELSGWECELYNCNKHLA